MTRSVYDKAAIKPNSGTLPLAVRDSGSEQRDSKLEDAGVKQLKQKSNLGFSKATSTFIMPMGSQHNVHCRILQGRFRATSDSAWGFR